MTLRSARLSPQAALTWTWLLLLALAGCTQGPAPGDSALQILSAHATSQTSILVTFDGPASTAAGDPANYVVTAPTGSKLGVLAAYLGKDGTTVSLATEPQEQVTYVLSVRNVGPASGGSSGEITTAGGFGGSGEVAPIVASAIALSNTEVLITFADPTSAKLSDMGAGALEPAYYEISSPNLDVIGASYADGGRDRTRVILTTSSMSDLVYRVKVTNVLSAQGSKLVDPFVNVADFLGITTGDAIAPQVKAVFPTSNTTLVIQFTEPVSDDAASPSRYTITDSGGTELPVVSAVLNDVKTEVTLTTWPMTAGVDYTVVIQGITDRNGNPIDHAGTPFNGTPVDASNDFTPPRVLSANSTTNTTVVVTFDEPVMGGSGSAENPDNYSIIDDAAMGSISTQAVLIVVDATLSASKRSVTLTTLSQSEIKYTLQVTDVKDLVGNQVVPPDRDHPFQVTFFGTGATGLPDDADQDGLSDAAEQRGWTVRVVDADGTVRSREVTSDPNAPDTDADGVSDLDEKTYGTDPRSADTDGDGLSDYQELNFIYSEPTMKDTDGDGLQDGLEFDFFGTSPITDDTDGDQFPDDLEIASQNRDPLVSDLPRLKILVGDVNLSLDERFTYTDAEGQTQQVTSASSTTLEQGTERTFSTSDTNTLQSSLGFSQELTVGGEYNFPGGSVSASATIGFEQSRAEEYTSAVSRESAERSNRVYNESVEKSTGFESTSEVVRSIEGASVQVALDLASISDVAFAATNLEVTAMWQDPVDPTRLVPVATLIPNVQLTTGDAPTYNLGPFVPGIGPILFANREIFPQTVEQLLQAPRGLVFKVANYDIQDEAGRNFAFSSQEAYDATVGIVIDDGQGNVTRERISSGAGRVAPYEDTNDDGVIELLCGGADDCDNNGDGTVDDGDRIIYNENGRMVGITMRDAMEMLDVDYGLSATGGVDVLDRIGSVSTNAAAHQAWVVFVSSEVYGGIGAGQELSATDFEDLVLRSGETYTLAYLQDQDLDKLFDREEYVHGSSDLFRHSDAGGGSNAATVTCPAEGYAFDWFQANPSATLPLDRPAFTCDTISDYDEVRVGWLVQVRGQTAEKAYSSPRIPDSDADGLVDHVELALGTHPTKRDTDGDGISDFDEVYGFRIRFRGDLSFSDLTDKFCAAKRSDPDAACTTGTAANFVTDPLDPDTDGDGISDGFEISLGANPQTADAADFIDTDQDGLSDSREDEFGSSKYEADTDGDGLPDLLEWMIGSNPLTSSSDGDGLSDYAELDIDTFGSLPGVTFNADDFKKMCGSPAYSATNCSYTPPTTPGLPYGTNPTKSDTDDDGLFDNAELAGWVVSVVGEDPRPVVPDPTKPDSDNDGLDDAAEFANLLDPTESDTDGDGSSDKKEVDRNADAETWNDTNPLEADQVVRLSFDIQGVNYSNGLICGDTDSSADVSGVLNYTIGGTTYAHTLGVRQNGTSTQVTTALLEDVHWGRHVYRKGAANISASGTDLTEDDTISVFANLGSFSESFPAGAEGLYVNTSRTFVQREVAGSDICRIDFTFNIERLDD